MIIKPKIRGFICTTAHPVGCAANVKQQINITQQQGALENGPKKVLIIGASSGYGLSSRITAAFGSGAATIGVFFEKPGTEKKTGSAGWYNTAAFDAEAKQAGLYAKHVNGDAFSNEAKEKTIELIKEDLGQVDLVIYSLASPVRKVPGTDTLVRSCLKPIGETYTSTAIDTNKDRIIEASVEPATEEEIVDTVTVMGGQDWELWMSALADAGVLAKGCQSVAYSYIGTAITWPIYWDGALGKAKMDLDRAANTIDADLKANNGSANVAVLKSVVTQASSAIPVMPLYISMAFKVMKEENVHEGCIEQINRLFRTQLFNAGADKNLDEANRLRLDDWELRDDIQQKCREIWPQVTTDNLFELTDYAGYKKEFLHLFGFSLEAVNYDEEINPLVEFDLETL
ncbi:trans-2-enoyl-CoA reductase [Cycloclasticus sp. 46_83_sub15_T18]|nr:trans-2-enoyl-CoA reductase [Cycloclasticus sp. 46_83_sub15_T18]OUR83228.1 trans-2-enoyl-CoA reductase [Cycloclasticus sp. 46_120_T64]